MAGASRDSSGGSGSGGAGSGGSTASKILA
ncbi:hypothetical protein Esi_0319_0020 [Ectocarpus siliculosus]|uniref:Uncharacterized protein n=1 Tax=Ectocarpus siliculosus TaxID=2880 RepID=D7FWZ1_ECTSI|nr:hypothetical protein Esi_0319_0020 [Ectocarpus siliculosus]|eukprot:CBJ32229.1 hypothetical protein Esi_0319_0020 [Ectocarpus siliculosus]